MKRATIITLLFTFLIILVFGIQSCRKKTSTVSPPNVPPPVNILTPPGFGFYVVGYFPSYRMVNEYPDKMYKMCNVINYAFANINASGTLDFNTQTKFDSLYSRAKANGIKVFLSINGAHADFARACASPSSRLVFILDVMKKVRQLKLDGIDMDWEYPTAADGTHETFAAMMKQLSDSLHVDAKYYLTAAITPGIYSGNIRDGIKTELFNYVDFFNIMVYDDFSTTVPYRQHSPFSMAVTSLNYWLNTRGMPVQKCVMGIPIYGRPSGITQSNTTLTYRSILLQGGSPLSDSAVVTAGGFSNYTIYYNGQPTVKKKAAYAKQVANGIMFWEFGQDANNDNSLIKAACDTIGRSY